MKITSKGHQDFEITFRLIQYEIMIMSTSFHNISTVASHLYLKMTSRMEFTLKCLLMIPLSDNQLARWKISLQDLAVLATAPDEF